MRIEGLLKKNLARLGALALGTSLLAIGACRTAPIHEPEFPIPSGMTLRQARIAVFAGIEDEHLSTKRVTALEMMQAPADTPSTWAPFRGAS